MGEPPADRAAAAPLECTSGSWVGSRRRRRGLAAAGRARALAAFNDRNGPFVYRDLYVFAYDLDGICLGGPPPTPAPEHHKKKGITQEKVGLWV